MIFVVLIVILVGIANFFYLLPPVVNWDEGTHALWGFKEWMALRNGDFPLFWQLSRDQFSYPPLGSWLIALTNLPVEFSLNLARFTSTIGFIAGGILVTLITKELNKSYKTNKTNWTNWIALFLFLTSPAILFYSVTVFKESWGMALTLLTLYLYFLALGKKKIIYYLLTGLSLTLLFFLKYNYAVLLGLVLGLEGVVEFILLTAGSVGRRSPPAIITFILKQLVLFLPIVIFASWWILTPDNKLPQFLDIMRSDWNPVTVGVGNSWQYLTFFAQSIRVSYVFSDVLFYLLLFGYVLSFKDLGIKKIRVLFVFFTINFVLGTMHAINLQDRYILTSVPALFLIVGYEFSYLSSRASPSTALGVNSVSVAIYSWLRLPRRPDVTSGLPRNDNKKNSNSAIQQFSNFLFVLLVILVLFDLRNFPQLLKSNATHMLLSPMYNESDYRDTLFNFNKKDWPRLRQGFGGQAHYKETPEGVIDYILDNVDITKPINYLGWTAEISPDWVELRRQMALRKNQGNQGNQGNKGNYLITIEVKPTSRLYTFDYRRANLWQLAKVREIAQNYAEKLISEKDFQELGVVVRIYSL